MKERSWKLLGWGGEDRESIPLLVDWAIRAVEADSWKEITEGPARGMVTCRIGRDWRERVEEWIVRDSAFAGSVDERHFDCVRCGACCHDNAVVLSREDLRRFEQGNRPDLGIRVRRVKGKTLLPLVGALKCCVHLEELKCTIYPLRPDMCREFPAGTEHCLTSREELYGSCFPPGM